jgi:DNA-binding winged helix-turn-helix (wHTH) protein
MGRVSFGPFVLDGESRELLQSPDLSPVHLTPKAMDLLLMLVAERRRILRKQEILDQIWPTSFVAEATLFSLVDDLRKALGDSGRRPRFVKNEHGIGYRFIAEVHEGERGECRVRCWLVSKFREEPLRDGEHILGRWKPSTLLLASPTVSRQHARIVVEGSDATLMDLNSKNGTFLNGHAIAVPQHLADGDEIGIGAFKFTFRTIDGNTATASEGDAPQP